MNDNEIIKALECCQSPTAECKNCPMPKDIQDDCRCMETISRNALSFINRQKAEIERLTTLAELGNMRANDYRVMRNKAKNARAEAIKEFAERLKTYFEIETNIFTNYIDNLVKEMVGDNNA